MPDEIGYSCWVVLHYEQPVNYRVMLEEQFPPPCSQYCNYEPKNPVLLHNTSDAVSSGICMDSLMPYRIAMI
jgi:hypothetical protein